MSYYSSRPTKQQQPPPAPPPHKPPAHFSNMHPQHGGLYPAAAAHLEHLQQQQQQQQQQFAHFHQQQLAMGSQPIQLAPAMPQHPFAEEAILAAQNIAVSNMTAPNLIPQNIPSQTLPVQNGTMEDHANAVDEEIGDLGGIGLQELLHGINPQMFGDLQTQAPDVIALLRKGNSFNSPSASTQGSAINISAAAAAAAAANSSPIDPDAITASQMGTSSAVPHVAAHNMQTAATEAYPYIAGMVDSASAPIMAAGLNVSSAIGSISTPLTNGVPTGTGNDHRANGRRNGTAAAAAAAAAAASAAASAAAGVGKSSRPRVGQKRGKVDEPTAVKQELSPMGGIYDANGGMTNGNVDIDMSDASENNEARKAIRAERNRQSAAASRARKKNHIKELERRVTALSKQNAKLQVQQLDAIRVRIVEEQRLLDENKMLRKDGVMKDLKIHELTNKLEKAGLEPQPERAAIQQLNLKRPSTWGSSTWSASKWGLGAGTK